MSNLGFVYDFETTGIPDYHSPSAGEGQPHVVQAAGALVDLDNRRILQSFDLIVKPDGWVIPAEVTAIHGITNEMANGVGVPEQVVVGLVFALATIGNMRIGHNESFDARIMRIGLKRFVGDEQAEAFKALGHYCTAVASSPICNLPPTEAQKKTNFKRKTPSLSEAYKHFYGVDMDDAHSAFGDVEGCMAVYFAIQDHGK